jgi:hypothetical protein
MLLEDFSRLAASSANFLIVGQERASLMNRVIA